MVIETRNFRVNIEKNEFVMVGREVGESSEILVVASSHN